MDKKDVIEIFTYGAKFGVIEVLKELNALDDKISLPKAKKAYGNKVVNKWLADGWIRLYSTGNEIRGKNYLRKSECETAKLMIDSLNILNQNVIEAGISPVHVKRSKNRRIILNND
jgi:hypothetical protein